MTAIVFYGETGSAQITFEAGVQLKIVGAALSAQGPVLASFQSGAWCLGSLRFARIICKGQVDVEFHGKGRSRRFGPFIDLTIDGPLVTTALGVLAQFRALEEVWSFADEAEADVVVIQEHPLPLAA